jgi:Rha family phage regulatory protein
MNELPQTITSLEVAEMVGRTHDNVLKDIRNVIKQIGGVKNHESYFSETSYRNSQNKELPCYLLTKKGCELYSTRMTGAKGTQFAVAYIERFNQMEEHIKESRMQLPTDPMEILKLTFEAQENTDKKVKEVENRVTDLEENMVLSAGDYGYISRRINQRVSEVARGFGKITQEQRGKLYVDINSGVKAVTGVSTRTQLRNRHYETVLDFINDWEPSTATKMQVRQMSLDLETA